VETVRDVTDATFDDEVLRPGRRVVVDFWAPWCGPCKAIEPVLEALAEEHAGVDFVRVDVDANVGTAARYNVLSLPTVMVFDGGEPRETVVGARSRKHYAKAIGSSSI
jgi:thioredoxin 1